MSCNKAGKAGGNKAEKMGENQAGGNRTAGAKRPEAEHLKSDRKSEKIRRYKPI